MKIGVICCVAGAPWSAAEELWAAMAEEAIVAGHDVLVAAYRWPTPAARLVALQRAGAKILYRSRGRLGRLDLWRNRVLPLFGQFFRARPDVVCVNQGDSYQMAGSPEREQLWQLVTRRIPYVLLSHGNYEWSPPNADCRLRAIECFRHARRACFVSRHNRRAVERQLAESLPHSTILRNPVNLRGADPEPWPTGDTWRLAHVARLEVGMKGQDVLLETLSSDPWKDRNWRLSIYGDGPHREYLERLIAFYGLQDRVVLRGVTDDIRAIWREHHLAVLPSRTESLPLTVVEAMICGRAALVTDVGGLRELIDDGVSGFFAAAASPRYLASKLEEAWARRTEWQAMGTRAHEAARAFMDPRPGLTFLKVMEEAHAAGRATGARQADAVSARC